MTTSAYYLNLPASGKGPGLLVLHPWWGLNDFIKDFCDRLSREGFVVLAPDLYHGHIAKTIPEAKLLRGKMIRPQAQADILSGLAVLRAHPALTSPGIGLVGFSLGAHFALWLAADYPEDIRAVTVFYGSRSTDFAASRAAFLGHYAQNNGYESASGVHNLKKNLRAAGCPVTIYTYPGTGHWFFESDRPEVYDPVAAHLAWERSLEFFHQHLG
jgi:carboxymethylenebutenolidase